MLNDALTPKRLQLLYELVPNTTSIGLLINPKNRNAASHRQHADKVASVMGIRVIVLTADSTEQYEAAFVAGRQQGISALLVGDDPLFDSRYQQLVEAAAKSVIPTMYYNARFCHGWRADQLRGELR